MEWICVLFVLTFGIGVASARAECISEEYTNSRPPQNPDSDSYYYYGFSLRGICKEADLQMISDEKERAKEAVNLKAHPEGFLRVSMLNLLNYSGELAEPPFKAYPF